MFEHLPDHGFQEILHVVHDDGSHVDGIFFRVCRRIGRACLVGESQGIEDEGDEFVHDPHKAELVRQDHAEVRPAGSRMVFQDPQEGGTGGVPIAFGQKGLAAFETLFQGRLLPGALGIPGIVIPAAVNKKKQKRREEKHGKDRTPFLFHHVS